MRSESTDFVFVCICLVVLSVGLSREECKQRQYVTLDTLGVIQCSFQTEYYGVFWYNSTDLYHDDAILIVEDSIKSGRGFIAGEFDVYPNGSLVIKNVSMKHEGIYTVLKLETLTSETVSYSVNVSVTAKTFISIPLITGCDNRDVLCFQIFNESSGVSCMVYDARPLIPVEWKVRTTEGDSNIPSTLLVLNASNSFYTSRVTTKNPFVYTSLLTLLVCKADSPPGLLKKRESFVLVQYEHDIHPTQELVKIYLELSSKLKLKCTNRSVSYFVWQVKGPLEKIFRNVLYSAVFNGNFTTHIEEDGYKLQNSDALTVNSIRVRHEGLYRCISGNGLINEVEKYDVTVVVLPDRGNLIVDGCSRQQYCVLEGKTEGSLTCTAKMIRPQVELDFNTVYETSSELLKFYEKKLIVKDNGDTFDISLTSNYRLTEASASRIMVECRVIDAEVKILDLSTKFDLHFLTTNDPPFLEEMSEQRHIKWLIAVLISVLSSIAVVSGAIAVVVKRRTKGPTGRTIAGNKMLYSQENERDAETVPLNDGKNTADLMEIFLFELRTKYQSLYETIQPIPYIRDKLYCVDRVFVEGGIECMVTKEGFDGPKVWTKLQTYHDILKDDQAKSMRRIVEGEPGYGKSTLSLQLAYDWCQKIPESYLKNVDVFILLRLRQLGGVSSIYNAIKRFLLPRDSKLKEGDVKNLVSNSHSVLVVLDGFDEYPDQDCEDSDVMSIIRRNMFQQFEVILTTRLSYLPKQYPVLAKRLKLTGFDDSGQSRYIEKAVVGNNVKAAIKIKQRLKDNPLLCDLCQVPLLFVMFAHMSHESKNFKNVKSVTSFFQYMIACFHSHMKNKMKDENVKKSSIFERDHCALDKLALKGLISKDHKIVWSKEELLGRLGQDFYDQYVRTGILVEEEILEDPTSSKSGDAEYKTEVRFYHKLFCEWYAAHYLSEFASRDDVSFSPWKESSRNGKQKNLNDEEICLHEDLLSGRGDSLLKLLDPVDLQYVYRFACGLNPVAAEKIINNLKTRKDASKFAILCILERKEKGENALKDVIDLCSRRIDIKNSYSLLLQRSTVQLLQIAIANKISVSMLRLCDCFSLVGEYGGNILLKSNLSIPVITSLKVLIIEENGKEITSVTGLMEYASKCLELETLQFSNCLLPQFIQDESHSVLRKFQVWWRPRELVSYQLDRVFGVWERALGFGVGLMTNEDYEKEVIAVRGY